MLKKIILTGLVAVTFTVTGCVYDKEELLYPGGTVCQGAANKFTDVFPIIQSKCAINSGCHAAGSNNAGGPLTSYDLIKNKAANIKHQVKTGLMPQLGSLTPAELQSIVCWVDAGALNN
ncbi:MAG TPA: hypothetical protein VGD17_07065 [Chitinophagaceae bacterium]